MENLSSFVGKEIVVKQIKGESGLNRKQKANLKGLGLKGRESESRLKANSSIMGMIKKIPHLVEVKLIK